MSEPEAVIDWDEAVSLVREIAPNAERTSYAVGFGDCGVMEAQDLTRCTTDADEHAVRIGYRSSRSVADGGSHDLVVFRELVTRIVNGSVWPDELALRFEHAGNWIQVDWNRRDSALANAAEHGS